MVFASAGTVNTGEIDPLDAIADLAQSSRLWFHVDAAYGGFFILTKRARHRFAGIERADSVVLDPHKGLFLPYGCGAVVVRDRAALRRGFALSSDYLDHVHREGVPSPADYSPELTRHFRALRLWTSLKLHGLERYRAALEEKLILAQLAHRRLATMEHVETGPEPALSCVSFRVRGADDAPTAALLARILARGRVHLSSTRLWGRLYLRLCVLSFRSHRSEVEEALEEIERAGSV
jgi:aromatic-L-amino-acid decarboxylase